MNFTGTIAATAMILNGIGTGIANGTTPSIKSDQAQLSEEHQDHMTPFERNFYLFNGLLGTLLNLAVLLIALLHVDTHDKPRQIIVVNMTMADLLTCTIYMLTRPYLSVFPRLLCTPYYVAIVSSQLCSCFNLLWINVDKLLFIKRPLHYYGLVSRRRVLLLMAATWMGLLLLVAGLYSFMNVKHACDDVELSARIYLLICVLYIVTILASFAVSAVIFCIAHNSRRGGNRKEAKLLFKRLFFVFSSTLWTFATCLPYRLLYLGILLSGISSPSPLIHSIVDIAYMLLVIGIMVNPLITIITQRLYRQWIGVYIWRLLHVFGVQKPKAADSAGTTTEISVGSQKRRSMASASAAQGEEKPLSGELARKLLITATGSRAGRLESVVELEEEESGMEQGGKVKGKR